MANWKILILSFFISNLIVSIARIFFEAGGYFFLEPGLNIEIFLTGFILLTFPTDDYYFSFPIGAEIIFSILFYTAVTFLLFKVWQSLKLEKSIKD